MRRTEACGLEQNESSTGAETTNTPSRLARVHFAVEDLARTKFMCVPAPLVETVLSLVELKRRIPQAYVRHSSRGLLPLPGTVRPLLDLIPVRGYWPEFLDPVAADLDEGLEIVRTTPQADLRDQLNDSLQGAGQPSAWLRAVADGEAEALETVQRGLRDAYAALVAPRWSRIVSLFRAGVTRDISNLASQGLAAGVGALHNGLVWRDGSLVRTVSAGLSGDFWLEGRGLQLVPSVMWSGPPLFSINARQPPGNALIYPLPRTANDQMREGPHDLAGLLGRTRAAALEAIRDPCGTAELASRLKISTASASEHAAVLRAANLARTTRHGQSVRHSLTPLGLSLLDGP